MIFEVKGVECTEVWVNYLNVIQIVGRVDSDLEGSLAVVVEEARHVCKWFTVKKREKVCVCVCERVMGLFTFFKKSGVREGIYTFFFLS